MNRSTRLEKLIGRLTRAYRRRLAAGRPVASLLRLNRVLSDAYLSAREEELNA